MEPLNVTKELSHVMLVLLNVMMKLSNVRKQTETEDDFFSSCKKLTRVRLMVPFGNASSHLYTSVFFSGYGTHLRS